MKVKAIDQEEIFAVWFIREFCPRYINNTYKGIKPIMSKRLKQKVHERRYANNNNPIKNICHLWSPEKCKLQPKRNYHSTPTRTANAKKTDYTKCCKKVELLKPSCIAFGSSTRYNHFRKRFGIFL